jgi:hypothetical protein
VGRRALSGLALAVAATLLAPVGAAAATDIHPLLAAPPRTDWIDLPPSPNRLIGDFTAHDYAAYQQGGSTPSTTEFDLNLYSFTRGYALEWAQRATNALLIERVFEFRQSRGARAWDSLLTIGIKTSREYTRDVPGPASVPGSYGALLTFSDGSLQDWIVFRKGNLTFVVVTNSFVNDLAATAAEQASIEYANAPSSTVVPPGAGLVLNDWLQRAGIVAGALFIALALGIAVTILLLTRRRGPKAPAGGSPLISPDGAYWWDGRMWRPRPPTRL